MTSDTREMILAQRAVAVLPPSLLGLEQKVCQKQIKE